MRPPQRYVGSVFGAVVTVVLLLVPFPYAFAPVLGGTLAGGLADPDLVAGARAGTLVGVFAIPLVTVVAVLLAAGVFPSGTGATGYASAMSGSGPRTVVFYAVFAYSYCVYCSLVALVVGGIVGVASSRGRDLFESAG